MGDRVVVCGSFAGFVFRMVLFYFAVLSVYVLLWHGVFSGVIPPSLSPAVSHVNSGLFSSGTALTVNFQSNADVKIYRYGFLPVYWSGVGDVTLYHQVCFSILTLELAAALILKYRQLKPLSGWKTFKMETPVEARLPAPTAKGVATANLKRSSAPRKGSRIVTFLWAVIGFLWFITYQLLSYLPPEMSSSLIGWIEILNLFMWVNLFASIGVTVLPLLRTIYRKVWEEEGGE